MPDERDMEVIVRRKPGPGEEATPAVYYASDEPELLALVLNWFHETQRVEMKLPPRREDGQPVTGTGMKNTGHA